MFTKQIIWCRKPRDDIFPSLVFNQKTIEHSQTFSILYGPFSPQERVWLCFTPFLDSKKERALVQVRYATLVYIHSYNFGQNLLRPT